MNSRVFTVDPEARTGDLEVFFYSMFTDINNERGRHSGPKVQFNGAFFDTYDEDSGKFLVKEVSGRDDIADFEVALDNYMQEAEVERARIAERAAIPKVDAPLQPVAFDELASTVAGEDELGVCRSVVLTTLRSRGVRVKASQVRDLIVTQDHFRQWVRDAEAGAPVEELCATYAHSYADAYDCFEVFQTDLLSKMKTFSRKNPAMMHRAAAVERHLNEVMALWKQAKEENIHSDIQGWNMICGALMGLVNKTVDEQGIFDRREAIDGDTASAAGAASDRRPDFLAPREFTDNEFNDIADEMEAVLDAREKKIAALSREAGQGLTARTIAEELEDAEYQAARSSLANLTDGPDLMPEFDLEEEMPLYDDDDDLTAVQEEEQNRAALAALGGSLFDMWTVELTKKRRRMEMGPDWDESETARQPRQPPARAQVPRPRRRRASGRSHRRPKGAPRQVDFSSVLSTAQPAPPQTPPVRRRGSGRAARQQPPRPQPPRPQPPRPQPPRPTTRNPMSPPMSPRPSFRSPARRSGGMSYFFVLAILLFFLALAQFFMATPAASSPSSSTPRLGITAVPADMPPMMPAPGPTAGLQYHAMGEVGFPVDREVAVWGESVGADSPVGGWVLSTWHNVVRPLVGQYLPSVVRTMADGAVYGLQRNMMD